VWSSVGLLLVLMHWSTPANSAVSAGAEFRVLQTTRIGGEGSWDYIEYEAAHHRLFVERVGGTRICGLRLYFSELRATICRRFFPFNGKMKSTSRVTHYHDLVNRTPKVRGAPASPLGTGPFATVPKRYFLSVTFLPHS
jgi:hypothetical protein